MDPIISAESALFRSRGLLVRVLLICVAALATAAPASAQAVLYVAEFGNAEYSRVTLTGAPPYTPSSYLSVPGSSPSDVLVDTAGNSYVTFRLGGNQTFIRKYDSGGTLVPGFGIGGTVNTGLGQPGLTSFGAGGTLLTVENQTLDARLTRRDPITGLLINNFNVISSQIIGVAEDAAGFVYVSAGGGIVRYNANGTGGVILSENGTDLINARGLEFDDMGRLLVMDQGSNQLFRFTVAGTTLSLDPTFGSGGMAMVPNTSTVDVDRDPLTGNIYVSLASGAIHRFDSNGLNGMNVVVSGLSQPVGLFITPIPEPSGLLLSAMGAGVLSSESGVEKKTSLCISVAAIAVLDEARMTKRGLRSKLIPPYKLEMCC